MKVLYLVCYSLFTIFSITQAVVFKSSTLVDAASSLDVLGIICKKSWMISRRDIWTSVEQRSLYVIIYLFALIPGLRFGPVTARLLSRRCSVWP